MDGSMSSISFGSLRGCARIAGAARVTCILVAAATMTTLAARADTTTPGGSRLASVELGDTPATRGRTATMRVPATTSDLGAAEPTVTAGEPKVTIYRAEPPQNFIIDLRLNPASDQAESEIALRLLSPRDYYVVRLDGRGERVAFLRVADGRAHEIAGVECPVAANAWHDLRVQAQANRFTVTLDGDWLFTAYDAALPQSGRLAVWTGAGSAVRFDAIAVTPLAPE